jgi:Fe-S oxidoreductase
VSAFNYCNDFAKAIRTDRLKEAEKRADCLLTTCTKCQIHFNCTLAEKKDSKLERINVEVRDLVTLIAEAMGVLNE